MDAKHWIREGVLTRPRVPGSGYAHHSKQECEQNCALIPHNPTTCDLSKRGATVTARHISQADSLLPRNSRACSLVYQYAVLSARDRKQRREKLRVTPRLARLCLCMFGCKWNGYHYSSYMLHFIRVTADAPWGTNVARTRRYEIFRKLSSGEVMWLETTTSLEGTSDRLKHLAEILPADYFVFDTENARFLVPNDVGFPTRESTTRPSLKTDLTNRSENSSKQNRNMERGDMPLQRLGGCRCRDEHLTSSSDVRVASVNEDHRPNGLSARRDPIARYSSFEWSAQS